MFASIWQILLSLKGGDDEKLIAGGECEAGTSGLTGAEGGRNMGGYHVHRITVCANLAFNYYLMTPLFLLFLLFLFLLLLFLLSSPLLSSFPPFSSPPFLSSSPPSQITLCATRASC